VRTYNRYKKTYYYHNEAGELHNENGPAIVSKSNNKYRAFYIKNKRHNLKGPAVTCTYKSSEYWVDGIKYEEKDYPQAVIHYELKQLVG
jgi:hypothetical protein